MSKILKSTTLGNVKNGGIFKALGKEFVKLDADEHGSGKGHLDENAVP